MTDYGFLLVEELIRRIKETLDYRASKRMSDAYTNSRLIDSLDYRAAYIIESLSVIAKVSPEETVALVANFLHGLFYREVGSDTAKAAKKVLREFVPMKYFVFPDSEVAAEVQREVASKRIFAYAELACGGTSGGTVLFIEDPVYQKIFEDFLERNFSGKYEVTTSFPGIN